MTFSVDIKNPFTPAAAAKNTARSLLPTAPKSEQILRINDRESALPILEIIKDRFADMSESENAFMHRPIKFVSLSCERRDEKYCSRLLSKKNYDIFAKEPDSYSLYSKFI